eukprot:GHVH01012418.1.p1 GENE.GHVH01012418.1~~GHVH01012418.1.p1  ORF type:complete len:113 (-),score=3.37 GHVH01012418.1:194-532(-)
MNANNSLLQKSFDVPNSKNCTSRETCSIFCSDLMRHFPHSKTNGSNAKTSASKPFDFEVHATMKFVTDAFVKLWTTLRTCSDDCWGSSWNRSGNKNNGSVPAPKRASKWAKV